MQIKKIARVHRARCVVVDPISALSQMGNEIVSHTVAGRLIDWAKTEGITLVCTSLLEGVASATSNMQIQGTELQISTIADTWLHLNYMVHAGERNRGLSIVKSRGTEHSNQVRELVLSHTGVTLADTYTAGGEVLMGTLRWEKERSVQVAMEDAAIVENQRKVTLDAEEAELKARLKIIEVALELKSAEKISQARLSANRAKESTRDETSMRTLRGGDVK
jgi:circadian clock protein KaiC